MKIAISKFKNECTQIIKKINETQMEVEITNHNRPVAYLRPATPSKKVNSPHPAYGALRGTITKIDDDFDTPLGDAEWDASH